MRHHRSSPERLAAAIVCAAGSICTTVPATAQVDQGPVVITPQAQTQWLGFDTLDLALELEWRLDRDERDPEVGSKVTDSTNRLREIIDIATTGYVWHPNLCELTLSGEFWFTQRWQDLESLGADEQNNDFFANYNASALFFREQLIPVRIYGFRTENDIDQVFGATLETRTEEYGAVATLQSDTIPTRVHVLHREQRQRDNIGETRYNIDQDTVQADGQVVLGDRQSLWWDASYDDIDADGNVSLVQSGVRRELNATHRLNMGGERLNFMRTQFRYYRETGDIDYRQLRLASGAYVTPNPDLATWADVIVDRIDRRLQEQHRRSLIWNFRHQLFESLTTIGNAGYRRFKVPTADFRANEYFAEIGWDYNKTVPYGGLYAGLRVGVSDLQETDRGIPIDVIDQTGTFGPSNLIVLEADNIIEQSIVITDLAGILVYIEGADYTVLALPDRVEIQRVIGGDIAPGETVLIDYAIGPEPGSDTSTTDLNVNVEYRITEGALAGLAFYTRALWQSQDRDSLDPLIDLEGNSFQDVVYGVEYEFWKMWLRAERQERRGSTSPFDADRFEARYVERLGPGSTLVLRSWYHEIDRRDVDLTMRTTTLQGEWSQRWSNRLYTNLILLWSDVSDNTGNDTEAFEQEFRLRWFYRQTELYARIRNSWRDTRSDDTLFQTFQVGLRREF